MSGEIRCCVLLGLVGCGPLAGSDWYGEALFAIEGVVQADEDIGDDVGVALLWSNEQALDGGTQAVVVETRFPARYRLKIFQPPPSETVLATVGGVPVEASVGQILLFADDGDGVWQPETEALVGGAYNAAVLYVPGTDALEAAPVEWQPSAGFHLMSKEPGPICGRTWEQWMEPADPRAATLQVGYYGGLGDDWDCDGERDFAGDLFQPGLDCAPTEVLEDECAMAELVADQVAIGDVGAPSRGWIEDFHGRLVEGCHPQVCGETIDRLGALLEP